MEIKDYRHADCDLFRTPSINISPIQKVIEIALLKAWESGSSVERAINSIVENNELIGPLARDIAPHMATQRTYALEKVKADSYLNIRAYEIQERKKVQEVDESLGVKVRGAEQQLSEVSQTYATNLHQYSAAQARLEEMRARIRAQLDEVGGKEGYKNLMEINSAVVAESPIGKRYQEQGKQEPSSPVLRDPINIDLINHHVQTLEDKLEIEQETGPKRKIRRVLKKVWEILNYELW